MTPNTCVLPVAGRWQIIVLSVMAGVTIANIYYCQPILAIIATSLNISAHQTGMLPVWTQVGYGIGLFFIAPLGDMFDRKKLIILLQILMLGTLFSATQSHSLSSLSLVCFGLGILGVSVQIVVPMAASLALPTEKGRVVGSVFTGTLTGILAARVVSGYIAEWFGWRWVFGFSMLLVFLVTLLFIMFLPNIKPTHSSPYLSLLHSTLQQGKRFNKLRRLSLLGALIFGAFCSFWTTLTLKLSASPFHFTSGTIGLFGLIAIVGAVLAPWFGKISDRSDPCRIQVFSVLLMVLAALMLQFWHSAISAMIIATLLLDIGMQITQVNNLSQIYRLDEHAHSRINTFFMTSLFWGGAAGTGAGLAAWSCGGWRLVCWQLILWTVMALWVTLKALKEVKS